MESQIEVTVQNPKQVKSTLTSYYIFTLAYTDRTGSNQVVKRYSDFDALRNTLLSRWPGVLIPSLPPKKIININQEFIIQRCSFLSQFCKGIAQRPHLWYSQQFQIFLSQNQVSKKLSILTKRSYADIFQQYNIAFQYAVDKEITTEVLVKVANFSGFINKSIVMMDSFRQALQILIKLQQVNQRDQITAIGAIFPDYQNVILNKYQVKKICSDPDFDSICACIQQIKNRSSSSHLIALYNQLSIQGKLIQAYYQALKSKKQLQQKRTQLQSKQKSLNQDLLNVGKGGFFSFLKGTPQQQKRKIQAVLQLTISQKQAITKLICISSTLFASFQIDRFKDQRKKAFLQILRQSAVCQKLLAQSKRQLYSILLQHPNCSL